MLARARESFEEGDYRWVAAGGEPRGVRRPGATGAARELQADALEQLGLPGRVRPLALLLPDRRARAARGRGARDGTLADAPNLDLLAALTAEMVLHVVGVRIDGPRADGRVIELDVVFTDVDESFALTVAHGALSHPRGRAAEAPATVRAPRLAFLALVGGVVTPADARRGRRDRGRGRRARCSTSCSSLLEAPPGRFPIVTP